MLGQITLIPDTQVKEGSLLFMDPNDSKEKTKIVWVDIKQATTTLFDKYNKVYINSKDYKIIRGMVEVWQKG